MKKQFILSLLVVAATASAQEGWTLRQCIDYAVEHNITIKQAENAAKQSEVEVGTAKWARLPNLNASASQRWNWGRTNVPIQNADGTYSSVYVDKSTSGSNISASTSIPLFTGFELPNQYKLAKLTLKANLADLQQARENIAVNVAVTYMQALLNREIYEVAVGQVALSKEQRDRIARLVEVGKAPQAELSDAESRVAQDELSVVQADNTYKLSILDLTQYIELDTPEGFSLAAPSAEEQTLKALTPPDEIYQVSVVQKPVIQAAQYRLQGAKHAVRVAQSGYYPTLSFSGSIGTSYNSTINEGLSDQLYHQFNRNLGFSLNIPLFNRFATRNRVRTARLQQQNYVLQLDKVEKALYKEIQQAWYSAVAAQSKYRSSAVAARAGSESFRLMNEKYTNGKASAVEFNEAKQNLLSVRLNELQAKYEYLFRSKILDFYKGIPIE